MGRIKNTEKNIKYGYISILITTVLSFISRSVFVKILGTDYLGANGLFTNILNVLSFAELGIGVAMNFSLYKPVAYGDREETKSLMHLYKKAYRIIAIIVAVLGIALLPFLRYIIKDAGKIAHNELVIYYLIFLFNTSTSYLVSYKFSLTNAEQKNYIQTNIQTVGTVFTYTIQIVVLIVTKNYLFYLISNSFVQLFQKIYSSYYMNKRYPILLEKDFAPLNEEKKAPIIKNIKALILHKIGDISVHQTDNILISTFISLSVVGIISNYNLVMLGVSQFINIIFNSVTSSFGNLIATEGIEKQYKTFKTYRYIGFWIYGFSAIAFYILLTPFISLWLGSDKTVDDVVIALIITNYYFMGHRIVINNFKTAAGLFDADKFVAIAQAVVNLVVSVIMVKQIGLAGIYVGTVLQGLVSTAIRPRLVYNRVFNMSSKEYYIDSIRFICVLLVPMVILKILKTYVFYASTWSNFIILTLLTAVLPNLFIMVTTRHRNEYKQIQSIILSKVKWR